MSVTRKSFAPVAVKAVIGAGLGLALATGAAADTPKKGGTLVIGFTSTPRHLNPAVQSGVATGMPGSQIFATPLRFDENWNPQPYLAESWKVSADGLSVTLNLRKNAKFHDGKPVTSEDVAFSIATIKKNHPFKSMFAPVVKVDTPDPHTAVLRLSKPHPAILLAMSSSLCAIIPKHVYGDGKDAKRHPMNLKPVGSGPFRFVEYVKGQHIILERDPNFFLKGKPYLDKIVYKINKNSTSLALGLERGDIHLRAFNTKSRELGRLKKNKSLVVTAQGYAAIGPIAWLAFNLKHPILGKKAVRQAIAYAVDRKFINGSLHSGLSKPAYGPIAMGNPLADRNAKRYDLDLDKANRMLDEAGYPRKESGVRFQVTLDTLLSQRDVAEYLKPQLKRVGIDVKLRIPPDFPTWANWVKSHEFDMTVDVVFNWGDPVIGVHRTYVTSNIRKGVIWSNTQSYSNAKVDALLEKAGVELDPAKRGQLYLEFQKIVTDELPVYWMYGLPYHTVYNKKVGNPPLTIWGTMAPMDNVYLK
ncbi:MAG: ABC transporter substrate-binding protein [Chloroflexi bacterium]|nr:ABC transporter substrate-binding protein [Chloroflexota bacterium]